MPEIVALQTEDFERHSAALAPNLREADREELAAHGQEPFQGLYGSCLASEGSAWAIVEGDETLALLGAGDCTETVGEGCCAPWLLGSDALVTKHRPWFIRNTPRIVTLADDRYQRHFNHVDARNKLHIRWLRWAGFMILPPVPLGPYRLPFHPIYRKVSPCVTPSRLRRRL